MSSESDSFRTETDSLGTVKVPAHALYGAQTQRAVNNFTLSGILMPRAFLRALGLIKAGYATANAQAGALSERTAAAIVAAAESVADGSYDNHFPVEVFQTGSATSSNMNANEVIATLAARATGADVHPNDDVNHGQSSNDVIPSCLHLASALLVVERLIPALEHLQRTLENRETELDQVVKTGRTHLMDALPITFAQEMSGWRAQLALCQQRLEGTLPRLQQLALGGTAVGSGVNALPGSAAAVCEWLTQRTGVRFRVADNHFAAMSAQDTAVELSGQLRVLAVALIKIANDLRWGGSGPLAGLGEWVLPELQPGSSIMPGKVNPVIPEAVVMAGYQVIGNDTAVTLGGQSGSFQLNVALPLIIHNLVQSIELTTNAAVLLADKVLVGLTVNVDAAAAKVARNPILVTALNNQIGYDLGARIAKQAYAEGRAVIDVAAELTDLDRETLEQLLDPLRLCRPEREN
ncbi:class II fumarate hydratase [Motiliproteus sediminis]|uniref:class II fumarate hydratase n=1 Tax=Motiliproteus sediminis TaxID=1468178 RepID=UPI001AEF3A47|nr:class II fumarate hydratase [Motiliproteus sediminis]